MICDVLDSLEVVTHLELLPKNVTEWNRRPRPPRMEAPAATTRRAAPQLARFSPGPYSSWLRGSRYWRLARPCAGRDPHPARLHGIRHFLRSNAIEPCRCSPRNGSNASSLRKSFSSRRCAYPCRTAVCANAQTDSGSGVNWRSIAPIIEERYAGRLKYLSFLLSSNASVTFTDAAEQAFAVRAQLLVMLGQCITIVDVPQLSAAANVSWLAPVVRRCATTLTSSIPLGMFTPQEIRIHAAVENSLREICRRLALLWAQFFDVGGRTRRRLQKRSRWDMGTLMS